MDANLIVGALLGIAVVVFLLMIRTKDLPEPVPVSPFQHLDDRKAIIYENLRDLQFEYRLDKLSDADYQATKLELQKDLATVMAETDRIKAELGMIPKANLPLKAVPPGPVKYTCPSCGVAFEKALKFCGECGKPMGGVA